VNIATKPLPPPPRRAAPPPGGPSEPSAPAVEGRWAVLSGRQAGAQRVMIYGPGGIGKSSLAALAPNPIVLDIEGSTRGIDVQRIDSGLTTWADLRACLQSNALDGYKTIIIDSVTKAEELAVQHTLDTVLNDKGQKVKSLEAYGFGKGDKHLYATFLLILGDLDRHVRAGRNVVLVSHVCTTPVPNPVGDDWIQYQPRLLTTKKGDNSIRERVFEWCDHVLFVGYDVLAEDGKGKGSGTRTIYTSEDAAHKAKVRGIEGGIAPMPFAHNRDGAVWPLILGGVA